MKSEGQAVKKAASILFELAALVALLLCIIFAGTVTQASASAARDAVYLSVSSLIWASICGGVSSVLRRA